MAFCTVVQHGQMTKALLMRQHMAAAVRSYGTQFFRCGNPPSHRSFANFNFPSKPNLGRVTKSCLFSTVARSSLSTHATSGPVDSPLMQSMEKKIKEHLSAKSVSVKDAYGDGRHVCIDVVSSAFEGQSAVNRQRMVYKAIWDELQETVHAVDQMTTKTPDEAAITK